MKKRVLFELRQEYYLTSVEPIYQMFARDPRYEICFHVGKDQKRFLGIFLISRQKEIEARMREKGLTITERVDNFDVVFSGDSLREPQIYGNALLINLDHGAGIKNLRYRNLNKREKAPYILVVEGSYRKKKLLECELHPDTRIEITGFPKLDPFFWEGYFKPAEILKPLGINPTQKKPIVLFAPSYKPTCIDFIEDKIAVLAEDYQVIIKLHPYSWGGKYAPHRQHRIYEKLVEKDKRIVLLPPDAHNILPCMAVAATMISEASAVINEFMAIGKHGIIFDVGAENMTHSDGTPIMEVDPRQWLASAFPHAQRAEQLPEAVRQALNPTPTMREKLQEYQKFLYDDTLDGKASERVKAIVDRELGFA